MSLNNRSTSATLEPVDRYFHEQPHKSTIVVLSSEEFQRLLEHHPCLRAKLQAIYRATLQPGQDAQPRQYVGLDSTESRRAIGQKEHAGRGRASTTESKHTWTQERGYRTAVSLIKKYRNVSGNRGDGFRDFTQLVSYMRDRNNDATIVPIPVEPHQPLNFDG
ncbi:hypothetical protein MMC14_006119 [Varicellaria rhodocarpa]|nr:hypothetical protein [Varicellaria rhodocarpa]